MWSSGVPGQLQLHTVFKVSLGYMRHGLKNRNKENQEDLSQLQSPASYAAILNLEHKPLIKHCQVWPRRMAHACISSIQETTGRRSTVCKISTVYIVSSRPTGAIEKDPFSETKAKTKKFKFSSTEVCNQITSKKLCRA